MMIGNRKACFGLVADFIAITVLFLLTYKSKAFYVEGYLIKAMAIMAGVVVLLTLRLMLVNGQLHRYRMNLDVLLLFLILVAIMLGGGVNEIVLNIGVTSLGVFVSNALPFLLFVLMFFSARCSRAEYVRYMFTILQVFAFLTLVLAVGMYLHRQPFVVFGFLFGMASEYARMHGHMGNPNDFAKLMGVAALYSLVWVVLSSARKTRQVHFLLLIMFVLGLVSAISLSAYLSFLSTVTLFWLLLMFLSSRRSASKLGLMLFTMAGLVALVGMFALTSEFSGVLLDPSNGILARFNTVGEGNLSGRLHIWEMIWSLAHSSEWWRLFVGYGNGWLSSQGLVAHNSFINALFSYGAIFLLVFLVLDFLLFRKLIEIYKKTREVWAMQMLVLLIYGHIESLAGNEIFSGLTVIGLFFCFVVVMAMVREPSAVESGGASQRR